jgi:hypothetical protein
MAADWPDLLPAFMEAEKLDRAFLSLMNYYGQSSGKAATALHNRIPVAYPEKGGRPRTLSPMDTMGLAAETPARHAARRDYWVNTLRPLLTDAGFIAELKRVEVRKKDMFYTTAHRDEDIRTLEQSVAYWNTHFSLVIVVQ